MLLRCCCSARAPVARIRPLVHLSSPSPGLPLQPPVDRRCLCFTKPRLAALASMASPSRLRRPASPSPATPGRPRRAHAISLAVSFFCTSPFSSLNFPCKRSAGDSERHGCTPEPSPSCSRSSASPESRAPASPASPASGQAALAALVPCLKGVDRDPRQGPAPASSLQARSGPR